MNIEEILRYANHIYNNTEYTHSKEKSVIAGLLDLYQQEKEKKIELEKENNHLKEQIQISNSLDNMYNLYISKDKIRDKIKQLEAQLEGDFLSEDFGIKVTDNIIKRTAQIDVLSELLKE